MEEMEVLLECGGEDVMEGARFMVIGKVIADKILNRRRVLTILRGLWTDEVVYGIREIGMNIYSISFRTKRVMERAMEESPWSVMRRWATKK